jgi:hypothetical protein
MTLNEVNDPVMKLRLDMAKLKTKIEEQDKHISELLIDQGKMARDIEALRKTVVSLVKKLGPNS